LKADNIADGPLAAALAAEHKYEVDENSAHPETPDFLETFRTQGTWEIKSSTGVDDVSLIRQFGAETYVPSSLISLAMEKQPQS
jgi:complement component 1 Q subcomponent-binding protein